MPVAITSYQKAVDWMVKPGGWETGRYVCVSNVHMCMEAFDDIDFAAIVNQADLVVPDGMPIVWALRALGENDASQVRGSDLMLLLCGEAQKRSIPVGLYGGVSKSLADLTKYLKAQYPSLEIPFASSPPFRELSWQEKDNYIKEINASGVRVLFVALGCPKQERWMAEHRDKLSCVMIGVGAAFDFFSGRKRHAPRWMQKAGLEWAFRLASEPRRLWKRYLKHNPRFMWHFGKQLLRERILPRSHAVE